MSFVSIVNDSKELSLFFPQEVLNIFNQYGSFDLVMWENEQH